MSHQYENTGKPGMDQPAPATEKKPYSRPELKKFGKVRDLTAGGGSANGEGGAMMP
jgi:hypothetical protein